MKKIIICLAILTSLGAIAQDTKRELPASWKNLTFGGQFSDRFLPMPILGKLTSDTWGAMDVVPRDVLNGVEDPAWSYWGGRFFLAPDGKYTSFICRWPENHPKGHWAYHYSEVVMVQSDNPIGPYKQVGEPVCLGHNPEIYQLQDGRWMLYTVGEGHDIHYFISDDLHGPWKKARYAFDQRDRKKLRFMVNVTFAQREDGSYLAMPRAGEMYISKDGIDMYSRISDESTYPRVEGHFEDPFIWKDHIQYHKIVNDWFGRIAYYQRSKDGIHWKTEPGAAYYPGISKYENGKLNTWYKYERIHMLQDEYGRAIQANFAVIDTIKFADYCCDNHNSKNISVPLVKEKLIELLSPKKNTNESATFKVLIKAEDDFNPLTDIDFETLRFGGSEAVNFGKGSQLISHKKKGKDVVLTFEGEGNGLTDNNFTAKLLGKTIQGELLIAYARLPWVDYKAPILSARKPFVEKNIVKIEVQNFGLSDSDNESLIVNFTTPYTSYIFKGKLPSLKPYEKTTVELSNPYNLDLKEVGNLMVYLKDKKDDLLYQREINLAPIQPFIERGEGTPLKIPEHFKAGTIANRVTRAANKVKYYIYFPKSFTYKKPGPVYVTFSPAGNGKEMVESLKEKAEKHNIIIVSCDGLTDETENIKKETEMENEFIGELFQTIPYNKKELYLLGNPGGNTRVKAILKRKGDLFKDIIDLKKL